MWGPQHNPKFVIELRSDPEGLLRLPPGFGFLNIFQPIFLHACVYIAQIIYRVLGGVYCGSFFKRIGPAQHAGNTSSQVLPFDVPPPIV